MSQFLKQSTAATIMFGPFVDKGDGVTLEIGAGIITSIDHATTGIFLSKAGGAAAIRHQSVTASVLDAYGMFKVTLDTTDTGTVGTLDVLMAEAATFLPVHKTFMVLPANVYDSLMGTDALQIDMIQVSGDSTSADNLELQYDGTGYVADTAPATQSQILGITNVGSAVSSPPLASPNGFVITTGGTETNNEDSAVALDGTHHTLADDTGVLDAYYEFKIGAGIPTSVTHTGYLTGNNDDLGVYAYDWVSSAWVQIGTLEGKASTSGEVNSYDIFTTMVGSGANEGTVRIRYYAASGLSTALLATDQIYVSFSRGNEGYDGGAIWVDTTYSNTGTIVGIDGTARNPVSTIAAANTLSASTNLNKFHIAPGSSITLAASQDNQIFEGYDWTLALGGQSISGSYILGAIVSGTATGASPPTFVECNIGTVTLPPCELRRCGFSGTITCGSAGDYFFNACFSEIAGTATPTFDFGTAVANTNLNMRHWSGGIQLEAMGNTGTDTASIEGWGQVIEGTCAGGTVVIRGNFTISGITNLTLSEVARIDTASVADAVWDEVKSGHTGATTFGDLATDIDNLNNISVADIIAGIADGSYDLQEMLRIIFAACALKSSGGGTTTIAFRDSADGKDRISATVDSDGNRSAVTLDGS